MPDYPDYTKPITITGVTIETLPIDIKAQTVGNITIDVAAQSVGNLNIDIKAVSDTVPVSNLGCLINTDFEKDWQGWMKTTDCFIDELVFHTGYKSVKIGHKNYVAQELSPALRGDRVKSLRVAYRSQVAGANKAIVTLINSDGTVTQTYLSPAAKDAWYTVDVNTDPTKEVLQFGLMGYAGSGKYVNFDTIGLALKEVLDAVNVTVNVDIVAQTVGNINVDIAAQTVGNLAVDIAAQTVGNINIDIAAQTVGNLNVDIKAQTVTLNIKTAVGEHVDTDVVSSVTLNVDIVAQTVGNISIDIAAQTVGNINVNIAASAVTVNVDVQNAYLYIRTEAAQNLNVDIAAQTVGNLTIDIAAITTTANLNVDIKAQTVDLNIKTSGGVNLVIDKLTQTAYLEDRRTLSNNGTTAIWVNRTGNDRAGKFFPRGCRGFIETIGVYCKDAGAAGGTITVYISPHPSMGYIASADVTVEAEGGAAWRSATFNRMWNYDSMFIFYVDSTADIKDARDAVEKPDWFTSTDAGATWTADTYRGWVRVVMKAMTVGDLPVAGHLDVTVIPSAGTYYESGNVEIPDQAAPETTVLSVVGAGKVDNFKWFCEHSAFFFYIYCDGVLAGRINPFEWNAYGFTASTPKHAISMYNLAGDNAGIEAVEYEFTREFKITAMQNTGAPVFCSVEVYINKIK